MTPRILVASQDPDTQEIFSAVLQHAGYAVLTLDDPLRLVHAAEGCCLVITNFPTEARDGYTVTRLLRADRRTRTVPILNATTHAMPEEIAAARVAGVSETILLPAPLHELVERVGRLVGSPRSGRETGATSDGDAPT
jgi:CheY-like chemotaxis protein